MMAEEWTRETADAELRKYGPEDLYYAVKHACMHDVDPVWRAALARATERERRQDATGPGERPGRRKS